MVRSTDASSSLSVIDPRVVQKHYDTRFEGFDFLRAIFSIAIVALKTNLFLLVELLISGALAYALMAKVAYLAVPVFLQISLFLFYFKSEDVGLSYFFSKRLPRLVSLYLFWVGMKVLFDIFWKGEFEGIRKIVSSPKSLIEFIVSGGQSPFFFFFALILLSTFAAILVSLFRKLEINQLRRPFINSGLLFASCLFVFGLSVIELVMNWFGNSSMPGLTRSASNIAFWDYNPFSFLPYLFTAAIVAQEFSEGKLDRWSSSLKLKLSSLLALSIFFTILEWHLFEKLLHYSRLSLVFGSWFILYLALVSPLKAPSSIKFLSACSLGIYGFHVFFTHYSYTGNINFLRNLFQAVPGLEIFVSFIVVLAGSISLTLVFKKIRVLKNYV